VSASPSKIAEAVEESRQHAIKAKYDRDLVNRILAEAHHTSRQSPALGKSLPPLLALIQAYFDGQWRHCEIEDIEWALAAALYVVSPWDLIPDYLPSGLRDDEKVVEYVTELTEETLVEFIRWDHVRQKRLRAEQTRMLRSAPPPAV
jgi:uncharacterized membrane protein YkvA (DUF1232 family)